MPHRGTTLSQQPASGAPPLLITVPPPLVIAPPPLMLAPASGHADE
eukprot:jgi/Mesvir1/19715/Mv25179-RA.1